MRQGVSTGGRNQLQCQNGPENGPEKSTDPPWVVHSLTATQPCNHSDAKNMKEPTMLLLNLSVFCESLGGSPPECQVLRNESKGVPRVNTLASMGTYRPSVSTILNLFLRGAKLYICPRSTAMLGEGARPRGWWRSRSLPGAREAEQRRSGAQGRDLIWCNQ